uniref:NADH-ubiquinone oxidoreductase chain 6 n=1 Tax=Bostrichoidea sp. 1 KM-2017 TaxID=2219275 RepID=A0A346RJM9_9COLE|nr:NADH dehydrogenase subunit 6 [Bostrichoidea sp. 1 KM-2017]
MINSLILINTTIIILSSHPLIMTMMIIILSVMIALKSGMFMSNFWFSYMLFMIMIGGMLILFVYMTSIAPNNMFKINQKILIVTVMASPIMIVINTNNSLMSFNNKNMMLEMTMMKYINNPTMMVTITMIVYLLIVLIATVKIAKIGDAPLRQKF